MDPKLQESLINLLVVVISIFAAALTTWWQQKQTKKEVEKTKDDLDAIADKLRATDKAIGIQTQRDPRTRSVNVTRMDTQTGSGSPQLLRNEGSGQPDQEAGKSNQG